MNPNIISRKEIIFDHNWIIELTAKAFETFEINDHWEGKLLNKLREELKI